MHTKPSLKWLSILLGKALLCKFLCLLLVIANTGCGNENRSQTKPIEFSKAPKQVTGLPASALQVVGYHFFKGFCALLETGEVYCWGGVGPLIYTQEDLKEDVPGDISVPAPIPSVNTAVQLGGGGGGDAICALDALHEANCFGAVGSGKLPSPVTLETGDTLERLMDDSEAGGIDSNGRSYSLFSDFHARDESYFAASGTASAYRKVTQFNDTRGSPPLDGGYAELLTDGTVYCFGPHNCGLPYDTNELVQAAAEASEPTPRLITGLPPVVHLGYGCVVGDDGLVYCWGANPHGELGTGDTQWFRPPFRPVKGVKDAARVFGMGSNRCAITKGGELWCWGDLVNDPGDCHHGEYEGAMRHYDPYNPPPPHVYTCEGVKPPEKILDDVVDVGMLLNTICAVKGDGDVYCWGSNAQGQLGIGGPLP